VVPTRETANATSGLGPNNGGTAVLAKIVEARKRAVGLTSNHDDRAVTLEGEPVTGVWDLPGPTCDQPVGRKDSFTF
jgi:hypothetical protein